MLIIGGQIHQSNSVNHQLSIATLSYYMINILGSNRICWNFILLVRILYACISNMLIMTKEFFSSCQKALCVCQFNGQIVCFRESQNLHYNTHIHDKADQLFTGFKCKTPWFMRPHMIISLLLYYGSWIVHYHQSYDIYSFM